MVSNSKYLSTFVSVMEHRRQVFFRLLGQKKSLDVTLKNSFAKQDSEAIAKTAGFLMQLIGKDNKLDTSSDYRNIRYFMAKNTKSFGTFIANRENIMNALRKASPGGLSFFPRDAHDIIYEQVNRFMLHNNRVYNEYLSKLLDIYEKEYLYLASKDYPNYFAKCYAEDTLFEGLSLQLFFIKHEAKQVSRLIREIKFKSSSHPLRDFLLAGLASVLAVGLFSDHSIYGFIIYFVSTTSFFGAVFFSPVMFRRLDDMMSLASSEVSSSVRRALVGFSDEIDGRLLG